MQSFHYPHFPTDIQTVHVALYTDVENSLSLRSRLIHASRLEGEDGADEREAMNLAFIDASLICSLLHLQTAIYQALLAKAQGALRTKTVHSEILWALNPTNNISEAIRRFGVDDESTSLIVVKICAPTLQGVKSMMHQAVAGIVAPFDELADITDWILIKRYYKLNSEPAVREAAKDSARERAIIEEIVTSSVAMKSVMG